MTADDGHDRLPAEPLREQPLPGQPWPHPSPTQLSSCTGTPLGSPGFAAAGFGPASTANPLVSGSRMSSDAASVPGSGGQARERSYVLSPNAWATTSVASTVQLLFWFGPLSHWPFLQRGQTCVGEVR